MDINNLIETLNLQDKSYTHAGRDYFNFDDMLDAIEKIVNDLASLKKSDKDSIKYLPKVSSNNIYHLAKAKSHGIYDYEIATISFGKYKGHLISDVLIKDFEYVCWCIINLDHFGLYPNSFYITLLKMTISSNNPKQIIVLLRNEDSIIKKAFNMNWEKIAMQNKHDEYLEDKESRRQHYNSNDEFSNPSSSPYYNDNLDMDQQSMEFWDSL